MQLLPSKQILNDIRQYVSALIITLTCIYILESAKYMERPVFNSLLFVNMFTTWLAILDTQLNVLPTIVKDKSN